LANHYCGEKQEENWVDVKLTQTKESRDRTTYHEEKYPHEPEKQMLSRWTVNRCRQTSKSWTGGHQTPDHVQRKLRKGGKQDPNARKGSHSRAGIQVLVKDKREK